MTVEWEISKRSFRCTVCDQRFEAGSKYKTALYIPGSRDSNKKIKAAFRKFAGEEPAKRVEYCQDCWDKKVMDPDYDSSWIGKVKEKEEVIEEEQPLEFTKENIVALVNEYLESAEKDDDQKIEDQALAYFIALMAERKKWLLHEEDKVDEEKQIKVAIFKEPKEETTITIPYPILAGDLLEETKLRLAQLMGYKGSTSRPVKQENEEATPDDNNQQEETEQAQDAPVIEESSTSDSESNSNTQEGTTTEENTSDSNNDDQDNENPSTTLDENSTEDSENTSSSNDFPVDYEDEDSEPNEGSSSTDIENENMDTVKTEKKEPGTTEQEILNNESET